MFAPFDSRGFNGIVGAGHDHLQMTRVIHEYPELAWLQPIVNHFSELAKR